MITFILRMFLFFVVLISLPTFATATTMWDFEVSGSSFTGTGHYEVSAPTSATGSLTDFSFTGTILGHDFTLALNNITFAFWDIDTTTWALNGLNLVSEFVDTNTSLVLARMSLRESDATGECWDVSPGELNRCGGASTFLRIVQASHTPSEPIPEPGTIVLLSTGLVGLAGYRWHQRRGKGTQTG